jgi:CRISPR-associated endonuclease/helicase Cas3
MVFCIFREICIAQRYFRKWHNGGDVSNFVCNIIPMNEKKFYAHSLELDPNQETWQDLEDHLFGVAKLASQFAAKFNSAEWGYVAGLWHDLGKYQHKFQQRLRGESIAVEHAGAGARLAFETDQHKGLALAFAIAGHHGGLMNLQTTDAGVTHLVERLKRNEGKLAGCHSNVPDEILDRPIPDFPEFLESSDFIHSGEKDRLRLRTELWVRFLFSSLIDADRSDTAIFTSPESEGHRGGCASVAELRRRHDEFIDEMVRNLPPERKVHAVNRVRADILRRCRDAAHYPPGIFSLTVPTGGGKTLSGMSFALNHAEIHGLHRVVVVIPYTSIIEQNAAIYRKCLGKANILEHHSNLDPQREREQIGHELTTKHQLATENWDAPVIVTTSVQFFETLFASKPSRARRLHNIAHSVIILDEVQTLPPGLLNPILDVLNQLVEHYRCSVVLSTATPPALATRERFEQGLRNVQPIITEPKALADTLQRVVIEWPQERENSLELPELASQLAAEERVLCVVHRRNDARELAQLLARETGEAVFHLSALMCPAHRLEVIRRIHKCLGKAGPCRVVSTQVVEAGVDFDFPVVYRALGGLDSVVQAAGRCNREGWLEFGRVVVFRSESKPPCGVPRTALDVMESLLKENCGTVDIADPAVFERYFRSLYFNAALDEKNIQANRCAFNYAIVGRDFRMIEDGFNYTVIVPWADADERLSHLRHALEHDLPKRDHLRVLQPYTISIYERSFINFQKAGALEEIVDGVYVLSMTHNHLYDKHYGLIEGDKPPDADPGNLVF